MHTYFAIYYQKAPLGKAFPDGSHFMYASIPIYDIDDALPENHNMIFVGIGATNEQREMIITHHMLIVAFYSGVPDAYHPN